MKHPNTGISPGEPPHNNLLSLTTCKITAKKGHVWEVIKYTSKFAIGVELQKCLKLLWLSWLLFCFYYYSMVHCVRFNV